MDLHASAHVSCPACLRLVTFDHVEIIGEAVVLACPYCAGVRIDLALEQVLARN
jgi:hypothetical protein